ncbi:DUF1294 domain-containing protein [Anaerovibrio lipolyticus]|uniref:DUF1294 domain-containing protein n=1 Tax=Anaerovibrio lipolyticus TaxID=82374 RepID=UPI001178A081
MNIHEFIVWYLAIINVIAIAVYGWDKLCTIQHRWRVPEKTRRIICYGPCICCSCY